MGSLSTVDVVDNHQYWRLVTSIFLCPGVPIRCRAPATPGVPVTGCMPTRSLLCFDQQEC